VASVVNVTHLSESQTAIDELQAHLLLMQIKPVVLHGQSLEQYESKPPSALRLHWHLPSIQVK